LSHRCHDIVLNFKSRLIDVNVSPSDRRSSTSATNFSVFFAGYGIVCMLRSFTQCYQSQGAK
jgi:hypothetical protein